ncbi:MAG: type II toxin-antitoxin system RelE/ParE family toxin [Clostridiales bacterium]|nr:type II toxin-antitoxin system RelE/ParE family toxin [Lachnospiraceae bacterium]MCD8126733.1 type II toxin-antitoxin system RelE/ParE family toxin [Clostridiales bacterium]
MENNKYALNIYPRAQADLEDIFRYISEELCNPSAAAALIDDIDESLDRVCLNPLMCPLVRSSLIKDKTLRKLIVKNYIVFYRPIEQKREIQVVRVLYGMMDYEKIL